MASASSSTTPTSMKPKRKSKPNPQPPAPQPKSELPLVRYPPFPIIPPDVEIIPYSQFKECGIRLHGSPSTGNGSSDVEIDGRGVPTVALKIRHETDSCKTFTRGQEQAENSNQKKAKSTLKETVAELTSVTKKDPVTRALELRQKKIQLFATKEWYEQWAEGESMRGTSVFDSNLTAINRIHYAANDFRKGRVWPLTSSGLTYLWDQFRLYAGLLGQPPVWYRTDLQQNPDDVVDEIEGDDEGSFEKLATSRVEDEKKEKTIFDDDFFDENSESDEPIQTQPTSNVEETPEDARPPPRKRIPPRTPYALHNIVPVALSSASQVKTLLSIASLRKYQKLETFIYSPDTSLRIFFSWYLHHQGFIFSPAYLANLPRLLLFFLEFLLKTKALYESDRALRAAIELTKKAITEVPAAGRMCKLLPDKMGVGCTRLWGRRWVEDLPFGFEAHQDQTTEEEAVKRFEEELKKENVQVVSAEGILPPVKDFKESPNLPSAENLDDPGDDSNAEITIQILSPTSPGFSHFGETPTVFIGEVNKENQIVEKTDVSNASQSKNVEEGTAEEISASQGTEILARPPESTTEPALGTQMPDEQRSLHTESETNQSIPSRWDAAPDDLTSSEEKSRLEVWIPKVGQPLMDLFGMTVLPLKYSFGVAERSMRRVREVVPIGGKSKEAVMERKWRGVQEELLRRLARVVLEPWLDWDDGGIAEAYRKPRVQRPQEETAESIDRPNPGVTAHLHNPEKDVIVILVEPRVAEQISIGMGLAGTWVQMTRIPYSRQEADSGTVDECEKSGFESSRDKTRARGRERGRGAGARASNVKDGHESPAIIETADQDPNHSLQERQTVSQVEAKDGSSGIANEVPSTQSGPRDARGRGRGHGRGGYHHRHQAGEEFVFWYVEDIFTAVPSFWMAGKEEEPIVMPEGEEDVLVDLSDLED